MRDVAILEYGTPENKIESFAGVYYTTTDAVNEADNRLRYSQIELMEGDDEGLYEIEHIDEVDSVNGLMIIRLLRNGTEIEWYRISHRTIGD